MDTVNYVQLLKLLRTTSAWTACQDYYTN